MTDAPVLRLEQLTKRYADVTAVAGVTLSIARGEFFSLLGPSGCGKTTTLRMLAGFETPDDGRIYLDDTDVTHVPPNRRNVNMVFQSYALFPHLDVARNVAYGLRRDRLPRAEVDARVSEALEMVQLPRSAYGTRRPAHLSGGQQQRVALARALVKRPRALLLDEPLGALDLKLRRGMQLELKSMQHRLGVAFVYVTHDQEEALTMSDRIAVMNEGRVVQLGTPRQIYERPRTPFVAGFIGVSNLVELPVQRADGPHLTLVAPSGHGRVTAVDPDGRAGERAVLSLRPERLGLRPVPAAGDGGGAGPAGCWLEATIRTSAYLGSDVQYDLDVPGLGRLLAKEAGGAQGWSDGAVVRVVWDPADAVVLADEPVPARGRRSRSDDPAATVSSPER